LSKKITQQERETFSVEGNLADAQVYLPLTPSQLAVLPGLQFFASQRASIAAEKAAFLEAFSEFHGGLDLSRCDNVLFGYSASMFIEIVANALRLRGLTRVGLLNPTYDATYHILGRHGCFLTPIDDGDLVSNPSELLATIGDLDALFLTLPNNPTGLEMDRRAFEQLCDHCASKGVILILDCCFRAYGLVGVDQYEIVLDSGVQAVVIEDTGKLFNVRDVKLGTLWAHGSISLLIAEIHRDYILEVPLFNLHAMRRLLEISGRSYAAYLRSIVAGNRLLSVAKLASVGFTSVGGHASNVQLFELPVVMQAKTLRSLLLKHGIGVVDADGFYWASRRRSRSYVRLALARPPSSFAELLDEIVALVRTQAR